MSGWEVRFSNSRKTPYFYNAQTQQSTWEPPAGMSEAEIHALPGAKYLTGGGEAGQVRASHILAKHAGSRRPSSWKQDRITRSLPEARQQIQAYIEQIQALPQDQQAAEFAKIASTESDCSSARKGGDLGWFGRGQMQKAFEDGTYALQVGEMSPIIESDSGVHVIYRTG
ncbi:transcriptional elongation regulator [Trichosporon asahii var. asahii CBS 8904]|uniref:Peptidyl-prolyl cis-trans isomerase n=2 Tax=Trichosporon asahii var. asahii TaxID=189963 RepID=K1V386_TRIAC|nr:transcriptional elongation regulator [Trichosporon asahii var. asahii CBS 2479]EJT49477.1 transcriptional elongation regulator [Trichosporon asahii var. asahii CBS 2479]EKC98404.1 transcriptional elongation regulator [Trichosporon asahii var. asahii CBS 8904]